MNKLFGQNRRNYKQLQGFKEGSEWCPGADSNHRHADFQSAALPTELPGRAVGPLRNGAERGL